MASFGSFWALLGCHRSNFSVQVALVKDRRGSGCAVFLLSAPLGVEASRAKEKRVAKCDFDDPYTVFAWFFVVPGGPLGALWG